MTDSNDDPPASQAPGTITAWSILAKWANSQDHWIRALTAEVAGTRKELSDIRVDAYYEQLLREKELAPGAAEVVPALDTVSATAPEEASLTLTAIEGTQNVNALAPGQTIVFNPRMTVLFGENGAGKTGYVRIMKRVAGVRSAETVLQDIWKSNSGMGPSATIKYSVGATEQAHTWRDEAGVYPFTRIDVFDARGAAIHVDDDLNYVYTPAEVSLFPLIHGAIERVRARLEEARVKAQPKGNPFTAQIPRDAFVFPKIESLGPATDLSDITALSVVSVEEEQGIGALRDRVEALRGKAAESRLQLARSDRDLYEKGRSLAAIAERFDSAVYNEAIQSLKLARARQTAAAADLLRTHSIPGAASPKWRAFIEAADHYLRETQQPDYPSGHDQDQCLYCRQKLSDDSVALLKQYREICSDASAAPMVAHQRALSSSTVQIQSFELRHLEELVRKRLETFSSPSECPDVLKKLLELCSSCKALQDSVSQESPFADAGLSTLARDTGKSLTGVIQGAEALLADLGKQAEERKKALDTESARLSSLEARLAVRALLPQILAFITGSKWASKAGAILARFKGLAKALTESSKLASERLLNTNFESLFQVECRLLAAPKVSLDFPGRKGQPTRRKTLAAKHRLSDVLSEGEQKALALADFLAESLLRVKPSPVIFDDPVNSLDYRRMGHVVDRLVELSKVRQVVVFTHNIWFTTELLARFESEAGQCSYFDVSHGDGGRGVVSRGSHPRADTLKALKGKVNKLVQDSGPLTGEAQNAVIEKAYEYLRSYCEVLVEEELLQNVTKRFQPNVMMTRLPKIKGERLATAVKVIVPLFEKACRYIASHSQPLETLNVRPSLADLKADWKSLLDAQDAYSKA